VVFYAYQFGCFLLENLVRKTMNSCSSEVNIDHNFAQILFGCLDYANLSTPNVLYHSNDDYFKKGLNKDQLNNNIENIILL
jgi:hypothetical protein